jgi:carbonic anhydrase
MKMFTYLFGIILVIPNILSKVIDFSEKDWPAVSCKGLRNSPIDFPTNYNYNTSNYFEILSTDYKTISNLSFNITNEKSYHVPGITKDMGTLFVRKNGITYRYTVFDIHFHILAEHTFGGKAGDIEFHIIHEKDTEYLKANNITDTDEDKVNKYLVVGTVFEASSPTDHPEFERFKISATGPEKITDLNLKVFSDPTYSYYHYVGGLTTPNCDEIVNWVVNANVVKISAKQNVAVRNWMTKLYPNGNTRAVVPLNTRTIYRKDPKPTILATTTNSGFLQGNLIVLFSALLAVFFF